MQVCVNLICDKCLEEKKVLVNFPCSLRDEPDHVYCKECLLKGLEVIQDETQTQ